MRRLTFALICALLHGCSSDVGPPLDVSGLSIYAPLPGSNAGVAYFTLHNNTDSVIVIDRVESANFGRVEIHESSLVDGVSRMRTIKNLRIDPDRSLALSERGKHLMLLDPRSEPHLGQPVTLLIHYDADGEIVVRSTLKSRVQLDIN